MKVTTLMENTLGPCKNLIAKHGLSLYIEAGDQRLLFDTGSDASFCRNAKALGVDLSQVDILVISHAHYDHGGGLEDFFNLNSQAKVYLSSYAGQEYYRKTEDELRYIGLNQEVLRNYQARLHYVAERTEISPGITLLPVTEHDSFKPHSPHLQRHEDDLIEDQYQHELIMTIEEKSKLHVFTGCSHNGIINMVLSVQKAFPNKKIQSLIGGFHLMNATTGRMKEDQATVLGIALALLTHDIEQIYTGHCTGIEAFEILHHVLGEKIDLFSTGKTFEIG